MSKQYSFYPEFDTDEALLKGLLEDDSRAYKQLLHIAETEIMPRWKYKVPQLSEDELRDALVDAVVVFVQKVHAYNAVRPVLFTISRNKIVDLIRKKVFTDKEDKTVYERITNVEDWDKLSPLQQLENSIVNGQFPYIPEQDFETFKRCLPTSEKAVFDRLCKSEQEEDIARNLNLSIARLANIKTAVKQKLKQFLGLGEKGLC